MINERGAGFIPERKIELSSEGKLVVEEVRLMGELKKSGHNTPLEQYEYCKRQPDSRQYLKDGVASLDKELAEATSSAAKAGIPKIIELYNLGLSILDQRDTSANARQEEWVDQEQKNGNYHAGFGGITRD